MLSQLQGQFLVFLAPSVPVFSSEGCDDTMGSPGTCSVPQFPHPAHSAVCGHPWVLFMSLSPLFPGTEVVVSVACGLVAEFPETHGLPLPPPAPWVTLAGQKEGVGRQRTLQPLEMPVPGLGWMHQAENNRVWRQDPALPPGEGKES